MFADVLLIAAFGAALARLAAAGTAPPPAEAVDPPVTDGADHVDEVDDAAKWAAFLSRAATTPGGRSEGDLTIAGLMVGERAWVRADAAHADAEGQLWLRAEAPITYQRREHLLEVRRTSGGYRLQEHPVHLTEPLLDDGELVPVIGTF